MSTNLICPDCGGVLGEAEEGVATCTCFKEQFRSSPRELDLAEETSAGAPSLSDTQPVEVVTKTCFKCGADVRGRKRFKDSRGYLCAPCNNQEVAAEREGTARCAECSRRVRQTALVEFRGSMICKLCLTELRDADKKQIKIISGKNYDKENKRTLKVLLVVLVILAIFMIISAWRVMHGRV